MLSATLGGTEGGLVEIRPPTFGNGNMGAEGDGG